MIISRVSAEIGGLPPFSELASLVLIRQLMNHVSHDFVSVDMRGLKAALLVRAQSKRVSVSEVVRMAVARELGLEAPEKSFLTGADLSSTAATVKLSIRLSPAEAKRLAEAARAAGTSRGGFIAGLLSGMAALPARADHVAALTASCAELAVLSRNLNHLTILLRQGSLRAAQEYREMMDNMPTEVRRHLRVAADALADLRPRRAAKAEAQRTHAMENEDG